MKHVISIENAKRLRELCVKSESYFGWYKYDKMEGFLVLDERDYLEGKDWRAPCKPVAPAYTAGELGEMLPLYVGGNATLNISMVDPWNVCYENEFGDTISAKDDRFCLGCVNDENLADALCKMLIWLIENGHVEAQELS